MRTAARISIIAGLLLLPGGVGAKGKPAPDPSSCPDVAAALREACPCDGEAVGDGTVVPWRTHGQYVSCVAHARNALRKGGCLSKDQRRGIQRCAARSTCGKTPATLCCVTTVGTCTDLVPGNAVAEGACSTDATKPCDVAADCTTVSSFTATDSASCVAAGGIAIGGSVCDRCPQP